MNYTENNKQMIIVIVLLLLCAGVIDAIHFNGGTIRWDPVDPYDNSSPVDITITQSYSWTYPNIDCNINVPITTSGRSTQNANLTCITDCSTDGGYSTNPIDILTDCVSISVALGIMTSQRSVNTTLAAGAHFYVSYMGSAWVALNDPAKAGLQWSITSFIDLRMRDDGFINTPPAASVASPQYAIVNRTTQIMIPVSDVNAGDDVRCRWSTYTSGVNRRKRSNDDIDHASVSHMYNNEAANEKVVYIRKRRGHPSHPVPTTPDPCQSCTTGCAKNCPCTCSTCTGTTCSGPKCKDGNVCPKTTTVAGATTQTTTIPTTTSETPGTLASTLSYVTRQAIDECGGICYPSSVPNGTTLSNCILSFTGLTPNTWYGIAIQVEDFINDTSLIPMSSVPVQFLIYVLPEPTCSLAPTIIPLAGCMEVTMGVSMSFNISVINNCDPSVSELADLVVTLGIDGMQSDVLTDSPTNDSLSYMSFTWTPQANQIGSQQMCMIAYTDEQVQSIQYCVTFIVTTSFSLCIPTTTSTSTSSTSTSTTSSTSSTSTSTSSTSSTSSTTSTTTTTTTSTTSTSTSSTSTTSTTTERSKANLQWLLIVGLSLLALLLAICCSCCCLYWLLWGAAARRRRRRKSAEEEPRRRTCSPSNPERISRTTSDIHRTFQWKKPNEVRDSDRNIQMSVVPVRDAQRVSVVRVNNAEKPPEVGNDRIKAPTKEGGDEITPIVRHSTVAVHRVSKVPKLETVDQPLRWYQS